MKSGLISWFVCISSVCLTITIVLGCSSRKYVGMNTADCTRELNSFLCEEFKNEYDGDFDSIKYGSSEILCDDLIVESKKS